MYYYMITLSFEFDIFINTCVNYHFVLCLHFDNYIYYKILWLYAVYHCAGCFQAEHIGWGGDVLPVGRAGGQGWVGTCHRSRHPFNLLSHPGQALGCFGSVLPAGADSSPLDGTPILPAPPPRLPSPPQKKCHLGSIHNMSLTQRDFSTCV